MEGSAVAASATVLPLQYPVGASNEALRAAVVRLVDVLRTIQSDLNTQAELDSISASIASLQSSYTSVQGDVDTISDQLTDVLAQSLTAQRAYEIDLDHATQATQGSRAEFEEYVKAEMMRLADGILRLRQLVRDNDTRIVDEQVVRVNENEAFASTITGVQATLATAQADILTEQTARATADTALATSISMVEASVDTNTADIATLSSAYVSGDAALAASISFLTASVDGNTAAITSESASRASADTALSGQITSLTSSVDSNTAAISSEATARADADTALSTSLTSLSSTVSSNTSAISAEAVTRADADTALSASITTLSASVDGNASAITAEAGARATADTALAASIASLTSTVDGNTAAITSEAAARASADSAIASDVTSLTTTVGGHTTSLTSLSASVDGIAAQWGVSINVDGNVSGVVRLDGGASGSSFTVLADKFLFVSPTDSGDVKPVFGAGNINGTPTFGVLGNAIIDGEILARHITVDNLAAISGDVGTLTAGIIQSPGGEVYWNLTTGVFTSIYYTELIDDLASATSAADAALNSSVTSLLTSVGLLETDVAALQSNELTPQERFQIALDHAIDTVQGSRREWQNYIENQMMNVVDLSLMLRRLANDNSANIVREEIVRNTETSSLAASLSAVTADLATTNAGVAAIAVAYADGDAALQSDIDGALASISTVSGDLSTLAGTVASQGTSIGALAADVTTVETTANGNTATITTLSASVDGIAAQWGVSVNANGRITGAITLNGMSNVSTVGVLADKFLIVNPTDDGNTITPFSVGLVNGVSTVAVDGTLVIDGTILARHIAANAITSAEIAAGGIDADRLNVTALTAITANFGDATVTGSLTGGPTGKLNINFTTGRIRGTA